MDPSAGRPRVTGRETEPAVAVDSAVRALDELVAEVAAEREVPPDDRRPLVTDAELDAVRSGLVDTRTSLDQGAVEPAEHRYRELMRHVSDQWDHRSRLAARLLELGQRLFR